MNWLIFAQIVIQEGFPFAVELHRLITTGGLPTEADFVRLRALSKNTATSKLTEALVASGIDLNSPEAKALLALTVPQPP